MGLHRFSHTVISIMSTLLVLAPLVQSKLEIGTVYDMLTANGLPIGLLPNCVDQFKFDDNGKFQVRLDHPCNAKFESELHYESNISGTLSYGRISNFTGVQAQELFLWFPVKSIHVDVPSSGVIYFDVGVVYKRFSLSLFESPPDCFSHDAQFLTSEKDKILQQQVPIEQTRGQ